MTDMKTLINGKTLIATAAVALSLVAGTVGPAQAKGCIKGAVVGGVAGHMAHHGVLGAAGGCAVGHHMASRQDRQTTQQMRGDEDQSRRMPNESR
jgi:hypothetical protein